MNVRNTILSDCWIRLGTEKDCHLWVTWFPKGFIYYTWKDIQEKILFSNNLLYLFLLNECVQICLDFFLYLCNMVFYFSLLFMRNWCLKFRLRLIWVSQYERKGLVVNTRQQTSMLLSPRTSTTRIFVSLKDIQMYVDPTE